MLQKIAFILLFFLTTTSSADTIDNHMVSELMITLNQQASSASLPAWVDYNYQDQLSISTTATNTSFFCNGIAVFCVEDDDCDSGCSCVSNICR